MIQTVDFSGRPFHFIGVGGIGMSALAQILAERKLPVSGSDLRRSHITKRLEGLGVHIFWGQDGDNLSHFQPSHEPPHYSSVSGPVSSSVSGPVSSSVSSSVSGPVSSSVSGSPLGDESVGSGGTAILVQAATQPVTQILKQLDVDYLPQVVCSTAIRSDNPEYQAALELGCPVFHRSDILAALIRVSSRSIAVAGTHGKTTTSGMIAHMMVHAGLDPTVVIGGEVNALGGNARLGHSDYLVAEADESDGSLVKFQPYLGVVTNAELDHPDHYSGLPQVIATFQKFSDRCQVLVGCWDCKNVRDNLPLDVTYSLSRKSGADYTADEIDYAGSGTRAVVWERGERLGEVRLNLLGSHNLSNALAAIAVGRHFGLEMEAIAAAISHYEGARRRFEYRGHANQIVFVDDYAHHPSELKVTLAAARLQIQTQTTRLPVLPARIVAVFQPHRFSRTQALLSDFKHCFGDADEVVVCEVYSAGEKNQGLADGRKLADAIRQNHSHVVYCDSLDAVKAHLKTTLQPQDLALFMGAGNLNQTIPDLVLHFEGSE